MTINQLFANVAFAQGKKLSGGITCNGLKIQLTHLPGKIAELLVTGDVTLTIKVFELTTTGAPKLNSLMQYTQHNIANKLKGETIEYGVPIDNYDTKSNKFNTRVPSIYDIRFRINYIVKLEKINRLSQLAGNDFVLAVVDRIGLKTDKLTTSGLTYGTKGPATVAYNDWVRFPNISTHEFFHTLGLPDLYEKSNDKKLMFHIAGKANNIISNKELSNMNSLLMIDLVNMSGGSYSNQTFNSVSKLQTFLNNPTNGFKYNKAKFR